MNNWYDPDKDEQMKQWVHPVPRHTRGLDYRDVARFLWKYYPGVVLIGIGVWLAFIGLFVTVLIMLKGG